MQTPDNVPQFNSIRRPQISFSNSENNIESEHPQESHYVHVYIYQLCNASNAVEVTMSRIDTIIQKPLNNCVLCMHSFIITWTCRGIY